MIFGDATGWRGKMVDCRRFSHANGLGDLSSFGTRIATCGNDCDVRIFSTIDDDYCKEFGISSDYSHCIAAWTTSDESMIAVGTDDFSVKIFKETGIFYTLLFRFNGSVNHMDVSKHQKYLVAGSSDFLIKIATLKDMNQCGVFSGHDAPVLSVQVSPDERNLASVSCDGTIRIWSIERKECLKIFDCLPKSSDISVNRFLGRMAWTQHCNSLLIVPCGYDGMRCFSNETWLERKGFLPSDKSESYSTSCWSSCGDFLATGTCDGSVVVWDMTRKVVSQRVQVASNFAITGVEFAGDTIVTLDAEGYISWIPNMPKPLTGQNTEVVPMADDPLCEDDLEIEDFRRKRFCPDDDIVVDVGRTVTVDHRSSTEVFNEVTAFQPTEAPRDLANRFMVYNLIGIVRSHQNNVTGVSSVEVEFHDSSLHHSLTIPNQYDYVMATLTESALCLACTSGDSHGSQLCCVCFDEQDSGKEWTLPMPKKEEIEAIAQGGDWIAVATNLHFLRIITLGGVQRQIFSFPGPVIALAAHREKLAMVFQGGLDACNQGLLKLWVVDVGDYIPKLKGMDLPVSPDSSLKWIGYSPSAMLATYDSNGILRVAIPSTMAWIPLLDTKPGLPKSDSYFAVGLSESPEEFRCILCKGTPYPPIQPRPVMLSLPLKIPMCEPSTERGKLEEEFIRNVTLSSMELTSLAKPLMKMFAISCKCGRKRRAMDVAELFPNWQMLELAVAYCRKNQLHSLCDKISLIIDKKRRIEEYRDPVHDELDNGSTFDENDALEIVETATSSKYEGKPVLHPIIPKHLHGEDRGKSTKVVPSKMNLTQECTNPFKIAGITSAVSEEGQTSSGLLQAMAVTTTKKKSSLLGETVSKECSSKGQEKVQQKLKDSFKFQPSPMDQSPSSEEQSNGQKPKGFSKWFDHIKDSLSQENPEETNVVRLGIKKWRKMTTDEKKPWM